MRVYHTQSKFLNQHHNYNWCADLFIVKYMVQQDNCLVDTVISCCVLLVKSKMYKCLKSNKVHVHSVCGSPKIGLDLFMLCPLFDHWKIWSFNH